MRRTWDPFEQPEEAIRRVYAYVAYRVGDGPQAEDITSETFERALRYRNSWDGRKGAWIPWLIGIARRCMDDALRREARPALAGPGPTAGEHLEDAVIRRLSLASAVATLDEKDRELIALRYGADLTARQIADLLLTRTNAVEVALHRAIASLRVAMREQDGAEVGPASTPRRRPTNPAVPAPAPGASET